MKNLNKANISWFLAKMMNEAWITASYVVSAQCRETPSIGACSLEVFEYLDIMGLFETGWMVFDHKWGGHDYGYPTNE